MSEMSEIIPAPLLPFLPLVQGVLTAIAALVVGWILSRWAQRWSLSALRGRQVDEALARFLSSFVQYTVLAAAAVSALGAVGIQTASVVALLASAGIAVGLALQGNLSNFASGVMILLFRPFRIDDVVTAAGQTGKVEDIGLFATTLLTPDNQTVIIPNGQVTSAVIVNITRRGTRRGEVSIGVGYGSDLDKVEAVLLAAASRCELVHADPAPAVAFVGFGASSLDFKVLVWSDAADYLGMLHDVRHEVYRGLEEAGIDIPFDQMVLHVPPEAAQVLARAS